MATAYLLASVLTLIVVLAHGQEAFPEQGNIVVVAEDSFEDELNSFTDLILPGSANTRAECIQKKKCKNKGGTCQNKGNTCPGKFVKGCSKGCSCCLPEEISCKPSKRCKRANGACIARGECNGKIISTGCKKPRSCKKTHVCCVQDDTVTELPTCRGDSRCLDADTCPNTKFVENHICYACNRRDVTPKDGVLEFLKGKDKKIKPYTVFYGEDFYGYKIQFEPINDDKMCIIEKSVQAWNCDYDKKQNKWKCYIQGFCTGESSTKDGEYSANSLKCNGCPNPVFEENHVCPYCQNPESDTACLFTEAAERPLKNAINIVFDGSTSINYYPSQFKDPSTQKEEKSCLIQEPVKTWKCEVEDGKWKKSTFLGTCIGQSRLTNGHSYEKSILCYKVFKGKKWRNDVCTDLDIFVNDPPLPASCMEICRVNDDCNAFNYHIGVGCYLQKCLEPIPDPDVDDVKYDGYYYEGGWDSNMFK